VIEGRNLRRHETGTYAAMNNFEAVERSNERRELVYIWLESSEVGEVVDD